MTIGVIADTHGLLRPEAVAALHGAELILHAGDVGAPAVLDALRAIAPTIAVRGNVDTAIWATALRPTEVVTVDGVMVFMVHDQADVPADPGAAGYSAVVFGHSHRPLAETRDGVLFLNPGSAGPRRFSLPVTVARLTIVEGRCAAEIVLLPI